MARGAESKEMITAKILETFPGSFKYDKEIRVPCVEGGETIQIKITLTAAKTNVEGGGDIATQGVTTASVSQTVPSSFMNEPTEEEKQKVADLCSKLGITPN